MSDQNPYAAPQAKSSASATPSPKPPTLSPEFVSAAQGASLCYRAHGLIIFYIVLTASFIFVSPAISSYYSYLIFLLPMISLAIPILLFIGTNQLSHMPLQTGAGKWFSYAFICFLIEWIGSAISYGIVYLMFTSSSNIPSYLMIIYAMLSTILLLCRNTFLLIGLWKLQEYLADKKLKLYIILLSVVVPLTAVIAFMQLLILPYWGIFILITVLIGPHKPEFYYTIIAFGTITLLNSVLNCLAYKRIHDLRPQHRQQTEKRTSFVDPHILKLGK